MKQCIIFSRTSTIAQDVIQQTNVLKDEAKRLGYDEQHQVIIEVKESAIKLDVAERKGIQMLEEEISRNPNIDCLVCYELSRIARRADVIYYVRNLLVDHKIRWIVCKPYMELIDMHGNLSQVASLMLGIFTSFAESEMKISKERMMRGKYAKMKQNKYVSGQCLFGYHVNENQEIEIDFEEAEIVRKIYKWYSEGKSMVWIAREMISRGYGADRLNGVNSYVCTLKHILRRREYLGEKKNYVYQRIISDELFNAVQEKLTKNKAKYITRKQYLGQGLIREGHSNLLMSPNAINYCINRVGRKPEVTLNTKAVEEGLEKICKERAETTSQEKANKIFLHDQNVINNKIRTIQAQIEYEKARIDRTNMRIINGKIDEAKGDDIIRGIEVEIERLNIQHNGLTNKLLSLKPDVVDLSDIHAVVRNEIEVIKAYRDDNDKQVKILEVHFRDGDIKKYKYRSWSRFCKIEDAEL